MHGVVGCFSLCQKVYGVLRRISVDLFAFRRFCGMPLQQDIIQANICSFHYAQWSVKLCKDIISTFCVLSNMCRCGLFTDPVWFYNSMQSILYETLYTYMYIDTPVGRGLKKPAMRKVDKKGEVTNSYVGV